MTDARERADPRPGADPRAGLAPRVAPGVAPRGASGVGHDAGVAAAPPARFDRHALQRRFLGGLAGAQVLSGLGMASGLAVGALLARDLSGSESLAGVGTTVQVLGSALIAVPVARLMASRGRRAGLHLGLALGFVGAALVVTAAVARSFPLLLVGMLLFGGGTTSNSQARYAAADLALPEHRGRDLSLVVWATTIGSVLGPNLVGPGKAFADAVGLPSLAGSFVFSLVGFALAFGVLALVLRPDPLLAARALARAEAAARTGGPDASAVMGELPGESTREAEEASDEATGQPLHEDHDGSMSRGVRVLRARPRALLGVVTMALGHLVMVSVMVMTPLHMEHGHAELEVIGFVISMHILGMFALSPVVGWAVDRTSARFVALVGGVVLVMAGLLASRSAEGWSGLLLVALFLLGVGWSCTLIAGSSMLTGAVTAQERPATQGLSDLVMGLAGASGGAVAGVVVSGLGYSTLAVGAAVAAALVILLHGLSRPASE